MLFMYRGYRVAFASTQNHPPESGMICRRKFPFSFLLMQCWEASRRGGCLLILCGVQAVRV